MSDQNPIEARLVESQGPPLQQPIAPPTDPIVTPLLPLKFGMNSINFSHKMKLYFSLFYEAVFFSFTVVGNAFLAAFCLYLLSFLEQPVIQAAYGVYNSYFVLFFIAFNGSTREKLGICLSQDFGEKDFTKFKKHLFQGVISNLGLFFMFTVPFFVFSQGILLSIGISEELSRLAREALVMALVPNFIQTFGEIGKTLCMSQGLERIFGKIAIVNCAATGAFSYYFIVRCRLGITGWIIAKIISESVTLISSIIVSRRGHPESLGFVSWEVVKDGLLSYFVDTLRFALGNYTEFIGYEITTYFVALSNSYADIAAYVSLLSFGGFVYRFGTAFSVILRTRVNILLGMDWRQTARNFFFFYTIGQTVLGLSAGLLLFIFSSNQARAYSGNDPVLYATLYTMFRVYSVALANEFLMCTISIGIKSIGRIDYLLKLNMIILIVVHPLTCLCLYLISAPTIFLFVSLCSYMFIINILSVRKCAITDWKGVDAKSCVHGDLERIVELIELDEDTENNVRNQHIDLENRLEK